MQSNYTKKILDLKDVYIKTVVHNNYSVITSLKPMSLYTLALNEVNQTKRIRDIIINRLRT